MNTHDDQAAWRPAKVASCVAAMLGVRLDRSMVEAGAMVAGVVGTVALCTWLAEMTVEALLVPGGGAERIGAEVAVGYVITMWGIYYLGHGVFYRLGLHRWMRRELGDERAYAWYSTGLGVIYFNLIWCTLPFFAVFHGTLATGALASAVMVLGGVLFVGSMFIKVWATLHLGVDGYYYRDMFLEARREGGPITQGPYSWCSDPMYSVGYFQAYAGACIALSLEGLLVALIFHVSIFAFSAWVEHPFVEEVYGEELAAEQAG